MTILYVSLLPTSAFDDAAKEINLTGQVPPWLKEEVSVALGQGPEAESLALHILTTAEVSHPATNPLFTLWGRPLAMKVDSEFALDISTMIVKKHIGKCKIVHLLVPKKYLTRDFIEEIASGISERLPDSVDLKVIGV